MGLTSRLLKCLLSGIVLSVLAALAVPSVHAQPERKVIVKPADLPADIRKTIEKAFPKGEIVRIQQEVEGKDVGQYDIDIRSEGKLYEVEMAPGGRIKESKAVKVLEPGPKQKGKEWTKVFYQETCTFSTIGRNRYFILEPGHQLVLEGKDEKVVITVTGETKKVGNIMTRVVEEREFEDGKLKEISKNFFAICREHRDVFYFGEDVDMYEKGKVVRHSGEWRADKRKSHAGLMMPGTALLGARFYQEIAPDAMDRAEIVADNVTFRTPAGMFRKCLKVEETSAIENDLCYKIYAPGVGVILDEDLVLTRYTSVRDAKP